MSDTSQGPGWWLASDGKWYPPQSQVTPPTGGGGKRWWKKKRFIVPLALLALFVVVGVAGSDSEDKAASTTATTGTSEAKPKSPESEKATRTTTPRLFPGRADAQKEDQERNVGESAQISGFTATLNKVGFQQELSVIEKDGYVVANVTIENRDKKSQSYSFTQWKVQTPNGEVIDATITSKNSASGLSADLVSGGKTTTDVVFKVGQTKGDFYIIYKPDPYDAARGIWKLTV